MGSKRRRIGKPPLDEKNVWRIIDANTNRAREGLRIIEDTARFILGRADAAKAMRQIRHKVDSLVRSHYKTLLENRDVAADSGRTNRAAPYAGGVSDLVAANFKRCEEALRVLEEYGRVMSVSTVKKTQALRFQVYQWEKRLHAHS